jgi:ubiquinone/menaquinone biosynthesis C-methylase UbiE
MSDADTATGRTADAAASDGAGARPFSADGIRDVYADQAAAMARLDVCNRLATGRARARLFGQARGRVLDVACGVGTNRRYVPPYATYVGLDLSPDVLGEAAARVDGDGAAVWGLCEGDAGRLPVADDAVDTVVSSLSTCTFPDPVAALDEMARVCRPDGRVLLLEHGRSSVDAVARFQEWRAEAHYRKHACRWTQEPLAVVGDSELVVERSRTAWLGTLTAIEARPG